MKNSCKKYNYIGHGYLIVNIPFALVSDLTAMVRLLICKLIREKKRFSISKPNMLTHV